MKIIIIGCGKIGKVIIGHVSEESHTVVAIDNNQAVIEDIINSYDVMGICSNGVNYDTLMQAGVDKADLIVAVTASDETNMLACMLAKKLGALNAIARVRDYDYTKQIKFMAQALGITMTINPELEAAREIMRIISFPASLKIDSFAQGNADLVELYVPEKSPFVGKTLAEIAIKYQTNALVCAVTRDEEVVIPAGNFVLQAKDRIHITASRENAKKFIAKLGMEEYKMKNILIIGGGRIAVFLAERLIRNKYSVKIVDKDPNRCQLLCETLKGATIVCGDGSDQNLLEEEGIRESDAVICLTGIDEENIIISLYADRLNVKKLITKVNKRSFADLLSTVETGSVITPAEIAGSQIVSYIRATSNIRGNNIKRMYKLVDNKVEALEFIATSSSKIINTPLKNLHIKSDALIGGIVREGELIIPNGNTAVKENDSVIVVTTSTELTDLDEILV